MGVSSATGPTPNKGYEASAMQGVGVILKQLYNLLPMAGPSSDIGKTILKAITELSKHVPPGSVTPAAERNSIDQMAIKNAQQAKMMQGMKPPGQPGQPGAPPGAGAPPGGAQPGMAA